MSFIASHILMVRPSHFGFNAQTAANNAFQHNLSDFTAQQIQDIALLEFDNMVNLLENHGIEVWVFNDEDNDTPDSIFPNNWFTTFTPEVVLYPMFSANRRKERKEEIYDDVSKRINKPLNASLLDLESAHEIVEGTGSLVCDYASKTAFAALSQRTTASAMDAFDTLSGFRSVRFHSYGPDGELIYHTNVMMTMADTYVVIGLDTITDADERGTVKRALTALGKEIIELSNDQVFNHFAGNMLQLSNANGDKFLVMSQAAYRALTPQQLETIKQHNNTIIACPIHMIEKIGGGSARCMMAEIFTH